jgi:hypothetical protein
MPKRRSVRGSDNTLLIVGGVAVVGVLALIMMNKSQPPAVVRVATPVPSQASTTAAELAAGAGVATSLINALSSSDDGDDNS